MSMVMISARNLSRASKSSLNCSGCWSSVAEMKDFSVSISGMGFVRRNGMERMFVAILAFARLFGDRQEVDRQRMDCLRNRLKVWICRKVLNHIHIVAESICTRQNATRHVTEQRCWR